VCPGDNGTSATQRATFSTRMSKTRPAGRRFAIWCQTRYYCPASAPVNLPVAALVQAHRMIRHTSISSITGMRTVTSRTIPGVELHGSCATTGIAVNSTDPDAAAAIASHQIVRSVAGGDAGLPAHNRRAKTIGATFVSDTYPLHFAVPGRERFRVLRRLRCTK